MVRIRFPPAVSRQTIGSSRRSRIVGSRGRLGTVAKLLGSNHQTDPTRSLSRVCDAGRLSVGAAGRRGNNINHGPSKGCGPAAIRPIYSRVSLVSFRCDRRCPPQAAFALARRARRRLPPRAADAVSSSARCAAVLMIAVWEKAWGKFPSCRLATGSYSSASRPRSFLSASKRSNSAIASSRRPISARLLASQKLQARKTPSPGGNPLLRRQSGRSWPAGVDAMS